jgi:hydrogenase/urease accessory protein HupE
MASLGIAHAHESRPAYLEITQQKAQRVHILWKQPIQGEFGLALRPQLSNGWLERNPDRTTRASTYLIREWSLSGAAASLEGTVVSVPDLADTIATVLVRVDVEGDEPREFFLTPDRPTHPLLEARSSALPVPEYLMLGVRHIIGGYDHLAFVLGLVLIVGLRRELVVTVTAFTLAHSLTLAAAVLRFTTASAPAIEMLVALSIIFVACEAIRVTRNQAVRERRSWLIAFGFGLLHGYAFAGALAHIGLPQQAIAPALLLFNVGVELGQLLFILAVFVVVRLWQTLLPSVHSKWVLARTAAAYAIGISGVYWFSDRFLTVFV